MSQAITREAALRVALAARALGDVAPKELIQALVARFELPLTETKLANVTVADLKVILQGDDVVEPDAPRENLKQAVRLLWGEGVTHSELPAPEGDGDLPGSIRVACASNNGEQLDGHFGSCERFLVYQVSPAAMHLVDLRSTLAADAEEDRNVARAALINDCQVVYVQSIGGPAVAKVVRAGVHPVKVSAGGTARETLVRLQQALNHPPPWLARIMGVKAGSLEKFAADIEADMAAGEA